MAPRRRLLLWVLAPAALLVVVLLSWSTPPRLPADPDHALEQAEAHCLTCHIHTGRHARPAGHPLRDDCFSCHRDPRGVLHPRPAAPTSLPGGWADDPRLARTHGSTGKASPPARP
ncbi:MAG TPA: hypothetical protein VMT45_12765 [Thermoanaerobaculaceae bacterium]|nr:hypothetical protein [Thermoanaerobaculaceae bacterium]